MRQTGEPGEGEAAVVGDPVGDALRAATEAADEGDAWRAVETLWRSPVLDGVVQRLRQRWPWLPRDDVDQATCEAFEAFHAVIMAGGKIREPVHWLSRVARNKAAQIMRDRDHEVLHDMSEVGQPKHGGESEVVLAADRRRDRAVAHARRLLPRLGQANVQAVMEMVIDAVEKQVPSLSLAEIAEALGQSPPSVKVWYWRGFERLKRLAVQEGLAAEDFRLEEADDEEED